MAILRTVSGKILDYGHGEWAPGDWQSDRDVTDAFTYLQYPALAVVGTSVAYDISAGLLPSKCLVFVGESGSSSSARRSGAAIIADVDNWIGALRPRNLTSSQGLYRETANVLAALSVVAVATASTAIVYHSLFKDGLDLVYQEQAPNQTWGALTRPRVSHTLATDLLGYPGMATQNVGGTGYTQSMQYMRVSRDRYVWVHAAVPDGHEARIFHSGNTVPANYALFNNGVAVFDLLDSTQPLNQLNEIRIHESNVYGSPVVDTTGVLDGIFGGDVFGDPVPTEWFYSPVFNLQNGLVQEFINPVAAQVINGSIIVQFEEITDSDYHELDYWNGVAWVRLATGLVAVDGIVSYVWNTDEIVLNEGAMLRARGITAPIPDDYVLTHTTVGLLLYDDFARADGLIGGDYREPDATLNFSRQVAGDVRLMEDVWKIDGGELLFTPAAEGTYYLLLAGLPEDLTEVLIRLRHGLIGAAQELGLVARYKEDLVGADADFLTAYAILGVPDGQFAARAFIDGVSAHLWPGSVIDDMPNDDREIYLHTSQNVGAGDYLGGAKHDETHQVTLQEPGITVAVGGDAGILVKKNNLNPVRFKELAIMRRNSVTVLGKEAGMYARLTGSHYYLSQGFQFNPEWSTDTIAFATFIYPFTTVEVWDDTGALVASITPPAGIWGGDVFTLELV